MKNLLKKILPFLFFLAAADLFAQTNGRDFKAVDAYVKSLGQLENMSMGTINNVVSNKFTDKMDKARAIYYWIAHSIKYDIKAARTNNTTKNTPADVLLSRKAVGIGFASLFQDMCSSADIRCLTVDGFVKNNINQINEKNVDINHSWAVVQLGQSPEDWYYVDPAFGSGYGDAEMKVFTPYYTDAYFFTDKETFNLQHYPDNEAWKLGKAPKGKNDFFEMPLVKVAAIELGLKKISPNEGNLKVKANKAVKFSFTIKSTEDITKVELGMGEKKKYKLEEIQYSNSASTLSFTYKFEDANSYPVTVFVNGKEFISYYVDVE
ncbi:MAG: transglutaminase domain-containing protein [Ferruginibacter sp.]